jgi:hypothetical protein
MVAWVFMYSNWSDICTQIRGVVPFLRVHLGGCLLPRARTCLITLTIHHLDANPAPKLRQPLQSGNAAEAKVYNRSQRSFLVRVLQITVTGMD